MPPLKATLALATAALAVRLWVPPPNASVPVPPKLPLLVPPLLSAREPASAVTTPVPTPLLVLLNPIWMSVLPAPDLV